MGWLLSENPNSRRLSWMWDTLDSQKKTGVSKKSVGRFGSPLSILKAADGDNVGVKKAYGSQNEKQTYC